MAGVFGSFTSVGDRIRVFWLFKPAVRIVSLLASTSTHQVQRQCREPNRYQCMLSVCAAICSMCILSGRSAAGAPCCTKRSCPANAACRSSWVMCHCLQSCATGAYASTAIACWQKNCLPAHLVHSCMALLWLSHRTMRFAWCAGCMLPGFVLIVCQSAAATALLIRQDHAARV